MDWDLGYFGSPAKVFSVNEEETPFLTPSSSFPFLLREHRLALPRVFT